MKEQFDRELRNHIKDTFDLYDDQMADDGWNKFKASKRRKRRGLIFWYALPSGLAAALALVWLMNFNSLIPATQNEDKLISKNESSNLKSNHNSELSKNSESESRISANTSKNLNYPLTSIKEGEITFEKTDVKSLTKEKENKNKEVISSKLNNQEINNIKTSLTAKIITSNNLKNEEIAPYNSILINENKFSTSTEVETSGLTIAQVESEPLTRENEIITQEKGLASTNTVKIKKPAPLARFTDATAKEPANKKKNNFKMSIDANTYYSFSENGVNNQLNLGLGLATELKLTKNLSLNSGILLNRQTATFDGNERSTSDFRLAVNSFAAVPSAQITNAKLVGLDIPINLKYAVKLGNIKSFITSGISSYSVINENYVNDFSIINYSFTGVNTSNITTRVQNPIGNFSYFKFARTLNLSFGILHPITKSSTLSVEPFMKYPLSGLGYQDLKIGSGGLSFKLNFGN
jgi:hypothetical protein